MSSKVNVRQKTAGALIQLLSKLPNRAIGMATDIQNAVYKINDRLRIFPNLYTEVHRPVDNAVELANIRPDLEDVQPGYRVRLLGLENAGDRAARVMVWDAGQAGETDFEAGIIRPLFDMEGKPWTASGAWVLDFVEAAAPVAVDAASLPTDLGDRVSFLRPLSERGRLISHHYVVLGQRHFAPPANPNLGDTYLLPPPPVTGFGAGWNTFAVGDIVWWDGEAWVSRQPSDGDTVYDQYQKMYYRFDVSENTWRWERSANTQKHQLPAGNTRPDVELHHRILPSVANDNLEALVGMQPGSTRMLYPGGEDIFLIHDADNVADTPGAIGFSLPAGVNYPFRANSNTPLLLERDIVDPIIRIIGGGLGDTRANNVVEDYTPPSVVVSIQGGNQAVDATVTNVVVNWTVTGGNDIATIRVRAGSGAFITKASTDTTHTFAGPYSADTTFEVEVTDVDNGLVGGNSGQGSQTLTFGKRVFYGPSPELTLTSTEINALQSVIQSNNDRTVTYDCTGGQYPYFVSPVSYGQPRAFINGIFENTDLAVSTVSHTTTDGVTEDYFVVRLNQIQNGSAVEIEWR